MIKSNTEIKYCVIEVVDVTRVIAVNFKFDHILSDQNLGLSSFVSWLWKLENSTYEGTNWL